MEEKILIEAKNLKKYFKVGANSQLHAVDGVNFKISPAAASPRWAACCCGSMMLPMVRSSTTAPTSPN